MSKTFSLAGTSNKKRRGKIPLLSQNHSSEILLIVAGSADRGIRVGNPQEEREAAGAMDIVAGVKQVWVAMTHTMPDGQPKIAPVP